MEHNRVQKCNPTYIVKKNSQQLRNKELFQLKKEYLHNTYS